MGGGDGFSLVKVILLCCAVLVHRDVLQFHEVKVNKKILWQNYLRG